MHTRLWSREPLELLRLEQRRSGLQRLPVLQQGRGWAEDVQLCDIRDRKELWWVHAAAQAVVPRK